MPNKNYEKLASMFSALSNPTRLNILDILTKACRKPDKGATCVCEINKHIDLPQPYISKHLKILKDSGILRYERDGNRIHYSFSNEFRNSYKDLIGFIKRFDCCLGR